MALHTPAYSRHMAQEKHQMLDLNRRLQTYLGRVKLLEEENMQLAQEIHALRHGHRGASVREKSLKEDLHRTREELDEVWRERVFAQMEVCKLSEEFQMVERHWQKEARAQAEVNAKMEVSRKELEEEHEAQRWLRERISELEEEMEHLVRNHEVDVARLETALIHRAPQRSTPTLDLLQLEEELSQQASTAWQETEQAYQAQLDQLEENLRESAAHLGQTERHKNEYQAQLMALERERISEGDVRRQLEETAEQQSEEHRRHINTLQEHLEGLEKEKQHVGQQLHHLVQENRGLLQQKMSLGLEVVTYRALLDSESLRRDDMGRLKESRNITLKDAPLRSLRGNYQLPARCNTLASVWRPSVTSTTPLRSNLENVSQVHKKEETTTKVARQQSTYPKILHDGAVEKFRAQEVDEKVTYAEPLSSPGEEEHPDEGGEEEYGGKLHSVAPPLNKEISQQQHVLETFSSSAIAPVEAYLVVDEQEITSRSGTEAILEATLESSTSSLSSQCDLNPEDMAEIRQEISYSTLGTSVAEGVDLLYPDGEEMDTWDSVVEKKIRVESSEPKLETESQYAEPEEDILTRRSELSREETKKQEEIWSRREERSPDINEEDEDSQNVSVSWRTEVESDSYAQENTLADTRPLIRYTSDDTDANTQASHVDESESSDGDAAGRAWNESKTKNFGTMEDLCEEVDEEVVEYDLGYSQEAPGLENVSEERLDEEIPAEVDDVEIETDRLVEQELENLSTDSYVSHFAQEVASENQTVLLEDEEEGWQEVEEEEVQDGMTKKEQNVITESDVQVETKMDLWDSVQPEKFQDMEEEKVQDGMMTLEEKSIPESEVQVECIQVLRDSVEPQLDTLDDHAKERVEEGELQYQIMTMEEEVIMKSEGQDHDLSQTHLDDLEKVQDEPLTMEHLEAGEGYLTSCMVPDVQDQPTPKDLILPQLDAKDNEEEMEEKEVRDGMLKQEKAEKVYSISCIESDVQVKSNLDLGPSQSESLSDGEKDQVEIMTMEQEETEKDENQTSNMDPDIQGEGNLDLEDFLPPQLDSPDDSVEEVPDEILKEEEAQKLYLLSCTESELQVEQPQLDSPDDGEKVQNEILTMEQEEADKVNMPSCMDPDVQDEDNLDISGFIQPHLDSPDDYVEEVQDLTSNQEDDIKLNLPVRIDPDLQDEDDLDLNDFIQPQLDYPDDYLEEVQDVTLNQEEAVKVNLPVCIDPDLQDEDNLLFGDSVQPQMDSTDNKEMKEGVQDASEAPEKREDEVMHDDETFSEFLSGPNLGEEDKEECLESQNQKGLLQQSTSMVEEAAGHLADEWNILKKTTKDVDIRHPEDEEKSIMSHHHEEGDDGEGAPTFDEKPVEISPETAPEESVILKDSLSEFHTTNGKDKKDFWASSVEDAAAYGSDDISTGMDFAGELDWGKAVNGSSKKAEPVTGVSVHSEDSEVEGGSWSSGDE
ncbi:nestin [Syngnathus typhle]|uniref:nestin n=1 Tax=Syngnathus typhle TaxID=161592 RepID=UPI002A6B44AC|nr:nestin [Syngnathus typhle]